MRRVWLSAALAVLCGCQPRPPDIVVRDPTGVTSVRTVLQSYVVCTLDVITISRSQYDRLDDLWSTTETGGLRGPDEKLMALNGLRLARSDMRFRKQLEGTLASMRSDPRRVTHLRVLEGKEQIFDVGKSLEDVTLFVWTAPDAVVGRHFRQARYRMALALDRVRENSAEFDVSWQVRTGSGLGRTASIPSLDVHVGLEAGQSLLVAPAGFGGRGVGRAFLSGVEEAAVEVTFFVITVKEIRRRTQPPGDRAEVRPGGVRRLWTSPRADAPFASVSPLRTAGRFS